MRNTLKSIIFLIMSSFISISAAASDRVAETADEVHPLLPGMTIPDVKVWNSAGKPASLLKITQSKPTILVFYRGGWCPYCNAQLNELQTIENQIESMGYQLLALSPELPDRIAEMQKEKELSYTMLSDYRLDAAVALGVAFRMTDASAAMYRTKLDAKLQKYADESRFTLPVPAVFVVDTEGVIQFQYVNPNYRVRLHPELLLTAAEVALKGENVRLKR